MTAITITPSFKLPLPPYILAFFIYKCVNNCLIFHQFIDLTVYFFFCHVFTFKLQKNVIFTHLKKVYEDLVNLYALINVLVLIVLHKMYEFRNLTPENVNINSSHSILRIRGVRRN